jgi:hypothetical protein
VFRCDPVERLRVYTPKAGKSCDDVVEFVKYEFRLRYVLNVLFVPTARDKVLVLDNNLTEVANSLKHHIVKKATDSTGKIDKTPEWWEKYLGKEVDDSGCPRLQSMKQNSIGKEITAMGGTIIPRKLEPEYDQSKLDLAQIKTKVLLMKLCESSQYIELSYFVTLSAHVRICVCFLLQMKSTYQHHFLSSIGKVAVALSLGRIQHMEYGKSILLIFFLMVIEGTWLTFTKNPRKPLLWRVKVLDRFSTLHIIILEKDATYLKFFTFGERK